MDISVVIAGGRGLSGNGKSTIRIFLKNKKKPGQEVGDRWSSVGSPGQAQAGGEGRSAVLGEEAILGEEAPCT